MPINFRNLVGSLATSYKIAKDIHDWLTDANLKRDFQKYLSDIETRQVLYAEWQYENVYLVLKSLSEILALTRKLRADHLANTDANKLLRSLITSIQTASDTIQGCDMHKQQGEFMAYKALLRLRTEIAKTLAIFCGMLDVSPKSTELELFIMNMAVVRPRA